MFLMMAFRVLVPYVKWHNLLEPGSQTASLVILFFKIWISRFTLKYCFDARVAPLWSRPFLPLHPTTNWA